MSLPVVVCSEGKWREVEGGADDLRTIERAARRAELQLRPRTKDGGNSADELARAARFVEWDKERRRIRFAGVAGYVRLGRFVFHVVPKFMACEAWPIRWSRLAVGGRRRGAIAVLPGSVGGSWIGRELIDPFARYFADELLSAIEAYPLLLRERLEGEFGYVRGRVLVERQMRRLPWERASIPCSVSRLTQDNQVSRMLRSTSQMLLRMTSERVTRRRLRVCLERLGSGGEQFVEWSARKQLPAGVDAYRIPVEVALRFWKSRRAALAGAGGAASGSVLSVMHASFEGLVSALVEASAARLGLTSRAQQPFVMAERCGPGLGTRRRSAVPDDVVFSEKPALVVDAKYKGVGRWVRDRSDATRGAVAAEDFNQIVTSCIAASVHGGMLIYPRIEDLAPEVPRMELWAVDSPAVRNQLRIGVCRLDLRNAASEKWFEMLVDQVASAMEAVGA